MKRRVNRRTTNAERPTTATPAAGVDQTKETVEGGGKDGQRKERSTINQSIKVFLLLCNPLKLGKPGKTDDTRRNKKKRGKSRSNSLSNMGNWL